MTVKDAIEEIENAKSLARFMDERASAADVHESDTYTNTSNMLYKYIAMLEDMKVRTN